MDARGLGRAAARVRAGGDQLSLLRFAGWDPRNRLQIVPGRNTIGVSPRKGKVVLSSNVSDSELKARHRAMWASGDYPDMVETFLLPLGPRLVEACSIGPGSVVLDVAAGTGNASIPAAKAGAQVTASDLTSELLDAGRARAESQGLTLEWVQADAEHLPFPDESFDVVISSIGAMFAPHHQDTANELVRVCRQGGTIGLLSWTPRAWSARCLGRWGRLFRHLHRVLNRRRCGAARSNLSELFGARVDFRTLQRDVLEVTAFEKAREFGEHFKAQYGPTIAARRTPPKPGARRSSTRRWTSSARNGSGTPDKARFEKEYLLTAGARAYSAVAEQGAAAHWRGPK